MSSNLKSSNKGAKNTNNTRTILSFAFTVVLAVLCGLFFAFGAKAEGLNKLKERQLPTAHINNLGVKLNGDTTVEQLSIKVADTDENYGGYVSAKALTKGAVLNDANKVQFETYSFMFDENLTKPEKLFDKKGSVTVPSDCFPAYSMGWEWGDDDIGTKHTVIFKRANGEVVNIKCVIVGTIKTSTLTLDYFAGEPYAYSYRSLLAVQNFDIAELYPNADNEVYLFTDIKPRDMVTMLSENDMGSLYTKIPDMSGIANENTEMSAIYKGYLLIVALVISAVALAFTGGKLRSYHYLAYAGVSAITMALAYYIKVSKSLFLYAINNTFFFWFTLMISLSVGVMVCLAIITMLIDKAKYKKINKVGEKSNDKTAKYI